MSPKKRTSRGATPRTSRRSFLRTGAATVGAALAVGRAMGEEKSGPLRLGIIGVGGRGTGLLQTLLLFPEVEIPAVSDLVRDRALHAAALVAAKRGKPAEVHSGSESAWEALVARSDLDAVIIATPWEWHAKMAVAAMRAGKYPGVEVPAAITLEECWALVRTSKETGVPCMMLENVCYFENVMALLRMAREGLFGEVQHCEAGYQHDCRFLSFDDTGELTWRGRHVAEKNGNLYPTHPLGPVAQWMGIHRGDRMVSLTSVSTPAKALRHYAAKRFGADSPAAKREYALGDVNTTLLQLASGRTITLYLNLMTHRPYDLILRLEGVRGIYLGSKDAICLEGADPPKHEWEPFAPWQTKYEHPLWAKLRGPALESGGHGGAEYLMFHDFLDALRRRVPAPQDVHDAAAWSAVFPLSIDSVAKGGRQVEFPDFTEGAWKEKPPLPVG